MHARVTTLSVSKDKITEATKIYHDSAAPEISKQKGFQACYWLTDQTTGQVLSVTIWDNATDADAYESSGEYKRQVAKVAALFSAPPTLANYTVGAHALAAANVKG